MKKILITIALVAFVAPAFAQSGFWIVQDSTTKKCTITSERPAASTTTTVVSPSGTTYTTRQEAEAGLKTVKVCESN
jgi:hypothetical protein